MRPTPPWFSKKSGIAGLLFGALLLPGGFTVAHAGALFVEIEDNFYDFNFTPLANNTVAQSGSRNLFGANGFVTTAAFIDSGSYRLSGANARATFNDGASGSVDRFDMTDLVITKTATDGTSLDISFGYNNFRQTTAQAFPTGKAVQITMDGIWGGGGTKQIIGTGFLESGEDTEQFRTAGGSLVTLSHSTSGTGSFGPPTPTTFLNNGRATCNANCFPQLFANMTISLVNNGSSLTLPGSVGVVSADLDSDLPSIQNIPEGSSSTLFLLAGGLLGVWLLQRGFAIRAAS